MKHAARWKALARRLFEQKRCWLGLPHSGLVRVLSTILSRWQAGEKAYELADDYGIPRGHLEPLRLAREVEAAAKTAVSYLHEWEYEDRGYDYSWCRACGWNTREDRTDEIRLDHRPGCDLRAALDVLERAWGQDVCQ